MWQGLVPGVFLSPPSSLDSEAPSPRRVNVLRGAGARRRHLGLSSAAWKPSGGVTRGPSGLSGPAALPPTQAHLRCGKPGRWRRTPGVAARGRYLSVGAAGGGRAGPRPAAGGARAAPRWRPALRARPSRRDLKGRTARPAVPRARRKAGRGVAGSGRGARRTGARSCRKGFAKAGGRSGASEAAPRARPQRSEHQPRDLHPPAKPQGY